MNEQAYKVACALELLREMRKIDSQQWLNLSLLNVASTGEEMDSQLAQTLDDAEAAYKAKKGRKSNNINKSYLGMKNGFPE